MDGMANKKGASQRRRSVVEERGSSANEQGSASEKAPYKKTFFSTGDFDVLYLNLFVFPFPVDEFRFLYLFTEHNIVRNLGIFLIVVKFEVDVSENLQIFSKIHAETGTRKTLNQRRVLVNHQMMVGVIFQIVVPGE